MLEKIRRFFWFCSGANVPLLEACPTEYTKNAAIGATIFFTAVIASLSGGYALFTVFKSHVLAVPFGVFWGMLIFNLDRFIVSSMRKESKILRDLSIALPRLIIAFIISIVVVVPIELRLFEKEIHTRFLEDNREKIRRYDEERLRGAENEGIEKIRADIETLENEWREHDAVLREVEEDREPGLRDLQMKVAMLKEQIAPIEDEKTSVVREILQLEVEATKERDGLRPPHPRGEGPIFRSLQALIESKRKYISELDRRIAGLEEEISRQNERIGEWRDETIQRKSMIAEIRGGIPDEIRAKEARISRLEREMEGRRERFVASLDTANTFLNRVNLLGKLARENPTMDWVVTFIRLLVIALEISPILVKLLSTRGPYDAYLEAVERESIVTQAIRLMEADDRCEIHRNYLQRARHGKIAGRVEAALKELGSPPPHEASAPRSWQ